MPALTSLRFFAASLVVLFHYRLANPTAPVPWFGYEAVVFFFILSGFVFGRVHADKSGATIGLAEFAKKRFARIAPAYMLGLIVSAPFFFKFHFSLAAAILSPLALQAWYPPAALGWNAPGWSLSVEVFLYACFIPAAFLCAKFKPLTVLIAAYAGIAACAVVRHYIANDNAAAYLPPLHLPFFIFGMAIARLPAPRLSHWLPIGGTVLAVAFGISSSIALAPLFGLLISTAAIIETGPLASPVPVLLGEASYSTYILHVGLLHWWDRLTDFPLFIDLPLYLLVVVAASVVSLFAIERPLRAAILRWTNRSHQRRQMPTSSIRQT